MDLDKEQLQMFKVYIIDRPKPAIKTQAINHVPNQGLQGF